MGGKLDIKIVLKIYEKIYEKFGNRHMIVPTCMLGDALLEKITSKVCHGSVFEPTKTHYYINKTTSSSYRVHILDDGEAALHQDHTCSVS